MDCNNLSTNSRKALVAFTLAEFLVAFGVGTTVLAAVCLLWGYSARNCATVMNYMDIANASRNALDVMSREIRNARSFKSVSSQQLVLSAYDPSGSNVDVTFKFDKSTKKLTRTSGGSTQTLLSGCENLVFSNYVASPLAGTFALTNVVPSTNSCKVVQISWICSRPLGGAKQTLDTQVSAKVLKRN